MTFQSAPYYPWIFPDEAFHLNRAVKGFAPNVVKPFNGVYGEPSSWAAEARQQVLDKISNTKRSLAGMEGKINVTARSQRQSRPASRYEYKNGVFEGSPMKYITSGNAFRGGVITTNEGKQWVKERIKQRIGELDAIATGNYSRGPPSEIVLSSVTEIDSLLSQIFSAFGSGSFTSSVNTALTSLISALLKNGSSLSASQVGDYSRAIQKLIETTRPYEGEGDEDEGFSGELYYSPEEKRIRFIRGINKSLKIVEAIMGEIARTVYDSKSSREQVMATLSSRLLGQQVQQYAPTFRPGVQEAVREAQAAPLGGPAREPLLAPEVPAPQPPPDEEEDFGEWGDFQQALPPAEEGVMEGFGRRKRHYKNKKY